MTVIAWDGHMMAADRMAGTQYLSYTRSQKIQRVERNGSLLGRAGDAAQAWELSVWYENGAKPADFPDSCRPGQPNSARILVITKAGEIHLYETGPYPHVTLGPYHAIGAGAEAALAVMVMGFDAKRAVEVASQVCAGCGNGLDILEL